MTEREAKLIQRGSGKWGRAGTPRIGWRCVDFFDSCENGEQRHLICEMCERTPIRYVHVMEHDHYPEPLQCGCVCAGCMEAEYEGGEEAAKKRAKEREKPLRQRANRRKRRSEATKAAETLLMQEDDLDSLRGMKWEAVERLRKAEQDGDSDPAYQQHLENVQEKIKAVAALRIEAFTLPPWKRTENGNQKISVYGILFVAVKRPYGGYALKRCRLNKWEPLSQEYPTLEAAHKAIENATKRKLREGAKVDPEHPESIFADNFC
jgi:hypothetical protein